MPINTTEINNILSSFNGLPISSDLAREMYEDLKPLDSDSRLYAVISMLMQIASWKVKINKEDLDE